MIFIYCFNIERDKIRVLIHVHMGVK